MDREAALILAAQLCRQFEGLILAPYLCPAGVPTIGYGSTRYRDGSHIRLTDPAIDRNEADRMLMHELTRICLPAVVRLCPVVTEPNRVAALLDFTYNLGAGRLQTSTLRRKINAEDPSAADEFLRWNKAGGVVMRGLVKRREAERRMWLGTV